MEAFLEIAFVIGYVALTIYLANQAQISKGGADSRRKVGVVNALLYLGVFLIGSFALALLLLLLEPQTAAEQGTAINPPEVALGVGIALMGAFLAFLAISSARARERLQVWIGTGGRYNPDSLVHTTAIVLTLLVLVSQIASFLAFGIAQEADVQDLFFQLALELFVAFMGVGWMIHRSTPQTLERLGLRLPPTWRDVGRGISTGLSLLGALLIFGMIVAAVDALLGGTLEEANATSEAFTMTFATLPLALAVSLTAAIGEEILFRGALQPIFGNLLVSVVFALLHTQALFSAGVIFLFLVSYALGMLRNRTSTTASIFAHFTYNVVQLLIAVALVQNGG